MGYQQWARPEYTADSGVIIPANSWVSAYETYPLTGIRNLCMLATPRGGNDGNTTNTRHFHIGAQYATSVNGYNWKNNYRIVYVSDEADANIVHFSADVLIIGYY